MLVPEAWEAYVGEKRGREGGGAKNPRTTNLPNVCGRAQTRASTLRFKPSTDMQLPRTAPCRLLSSDAARRTNLELNGAFGGVLHSFMDI